MKVTILKSIASKNYSYSKGKTIDLLKKDAEKLIKAGVAESAEPEKAKKTAPKQTATKKAPQKKVTKDANDD